MRSLILKHREWERIFAKIKEEYADTPSMFLIRSKMKDTLGFTVREHQHEYDYDSVNYSLDDDWRDQRSQIHIDFYDESAKTMFVLKYYDQS